MWEERRSYVDLVTGPRVVCSGWKGSADLCPSPSLVFSVVYHYHVQVFFWIRFPSRLMEPRVHFRGLLLTCLATYSLWIRP